MGYRNMAARRRAAWAASTAMALSVPAGFAARWNPPYTFTRSARDGYATDFNIETLAPVAGRTLYINPNTGNNSNTGLSTGQALLNPSGLVGKVQEGDTVEIVGLTGDVIWRSTVGWPASPGFAVRFALRNRSSQYRAIIAGASSTVATWSSNPTYGHVATAATGATTGTLTDAYLRARPYKMVSGGSGYAVNDTVTLANGAVLVVRGVLAGAIKVWDTLTPAHIVVDNAVSQTATSGAGTGALFVSVMDAPLMFVAHRRVDTLAEVAAQRGTYTNDGTSTHMNPADGRTVTGALPFIVVGGTSNPAASQNASASGTMFLEGLDFIGGQAAFQVAFSGTTNKPRFAFKKCSLQNSRGNALHAQAYADFVFLEPGFYFAANDGFNLHNFAGPGDLNSSPTALVIGGASMGSGTTNSTVATTSDNDVTTHEESAAILLNHSVCGSDDRVVAIIDDSHLWMMGGSVGTAKQAVTSSGSSTVRTLTTAEIWLDGVTVGETVGQSETYNIQPGTTLHHRNLATVPTSTGGGSIAAYN